MESLTYTYAPNGNGLGMDRQGVAMPRPDAASNITYNNANRMLTFKTQNITHDNNGNMTTVTNTCGTTTYTWDVRNRLVGMSGYKPNCTSLAVSFKYDGLGRRIEKTINGRLIKYLYDGYDIVQEVENSVPTVNYIRTLNIDEPLARIQASPSSVRYFHMDALGSVIALTNEAGQKVTQYAYDAFGLVTASGEATDNSFQYTGRENDGTGLYYYRSRYYNPELQRFISEDPILKPGNPNAPCIVKFLTAPAKLHNYNYAGNNPVNKDDPFGYSSGMRTSCPACPTYTGCTLIDYFDFLYFPYGQYPTGAKRKCTYRCTEKRWCGKDKEYEYSETIDCDTSHQI
ncbi:MAG: hypothetical protein HZB33_15350 [Nitrospirae bacterium]|nr:hypothetical protein [Nitrospirota bacterium]